MQQNKEGDRRASEPGSKGAQVGWLTVLAQPKGGWQAAEPGSKGAQARACIGG